MRLSTAKNCALTLLVTLIGTSRISAQCTYCGLPLLQLSAGARPLGLGGAYAAGDGPDAVFYNPAQLGSGHGSEINLARAGGASIGEFATTGSLAGFGIGAGLRFSSRAGSSVTPADQLPSGELVGTVAAATRTHGIWLGGSASFVSGDLSWGGGGPSFGAGAAVRLVGLRVGLSVLNIGPELDGNPLPTTVSVGAMTPTIALGPYFDLAASAELGRERDGDLFPRGGVELTYEPVSGWTVTARAGVRRSPLEAGRVPQSALSLGASFGLDAVTLDYAFVPAAGGVPATHSLGLRIQ